MEKKKIAGYVDVKSLYIIDEQVFLLCFFFFLLFRPLSLVTNRKKMVKLRRTLYKIRGIWG